MTKWMNNPSAILLICLVSITIQLNESIKCFYCESPGTKIAPQLWLHTEPCTKRRAINCKLPEQMCVVVRLSHERLNFTVAGCSEDQFEGCDQRIQLIPYGPISLHICQCRTDRCNSDFHMDFGSTLGKIRKHMPKPVEEGKLPLLKKVHPINSIKNGRGMPCADEQCNEDAVSSEVARPSLSSLYLFLTYLTLRAVKEFV